MHHQYLQWDSDFFQFKTAEIKSPGLYDTAALAELVGRLREEGCRLIYLYIRPDDAAASAYAAAQGWLLADEKVTYVLDLEPAAARAGAADGISAYTASSPTPALISLAIQSGQWSRFRVDKNFPAAAVDRMYEQWLEKSVAGTMADAVLVHQSQEHIDGLVTVAVKDGVGDIGLIAVAASTRGQGIGTRLMQAAIDYFLTKPVQRIQVVTQKRNVLACKFYEKNNFKVGNVINLYHVWL